MLQVNHQNVFNFFDDPKIYLIASSSSISILMPNRQRGTNEKQWIEILS